MCVYYNIKIITLQYYITIFQYKYFIYWYLSIYLSNLSDIQLDIQQYNK